MYGIQKLEFGDQNFEARRGVIETMNVEVTLTVEEGQKVVYLRWLPGPDAQLRLPIPSLLSTFENTISHGGDHNMTPFVFTSRIIIS